MTKRNVELWDGRSEVIVVPERSCAIELTGFTDIDRPAGYKTRTVRPSPKSNLMISLGIISLAVVVSVGLAVSVFVYKINQTKDETLAKVGDTVKENTPSKLKAELTPAQSAAIYEESRKAAKEGAQDGLKEVLKEFEVKVTKTSSLFLKEQADKMKALANEKKMAEELAKVKREKAAAIALATKNASAAGQLELVREKSGYPVPGSMAEFVTWGKLQLAINESTVNYDSEGPCLVDVNGKRVWDPVRKKCAIAIGKYQQNTLYLPDRMKKHCGRPYVSDQDFKSDHACQEKMATEMLEDYYKDCPSDLTQRAICFHHFHIGRFASFKTSDGNMSVREYLENTFRTNRGQKLTSSQTKAINKYVSRVEKERAQARAKK